MKKLKRLVAIIPCAAKFSHKKPPEFVPPDHECLRKTMSIRTLNTPSPADYLYVVMEETKTLQAIHWRPFVTSRISKLTPSALRPTLRVTLSAYTSFAIKTVYMLRPLPFICPVPSWVRPSRFMANFRSRTVTRYYKFIPEYNLVDPLALSSSASSVLCRLCRDIS